MEMLTYVDLVLLSYVLRLDKGSNPTGASLSLDRKEKIYALAQKHGLIILEDDPYYYMQFSKERGNLSMFLSRLFCGISYPL